MKAEPIPVKNLLGKQFNIPYYQRGYRWEEKQVNDLLNDLQEFYFKTTDKNSEASFYCMQTLVVVKNNQLTPGNTNPVYDLIDGQQRLTTIYLLLLYIKSKVSDFEDDLYRLTYERMGNDISEGLFKEDNLRDLTDDSKSYLSQYNDFIFLFKAYQTIKNWFAETGHMKASKMLEILIGDGTLRPDQNDVRFLWYEPDQEIDSESEANVLRGSIDIFNRLNYGQTPLSSTDLIKAMLMISDIYPDNMRRLQEEQSSRYASEWDQMEKRLHDRLLWAMLVPNGYNPASRMELLFDYVAHSFYENEHKEDWEKKAYTKIKPEDNDFSYRVISAYLLYCENGIVNSDEYKKRVENVWRKVQRVYHMFCNWYQNRKTYHLIGLYLLLHENPLGEQIESRYNLFKRIIKEYTTLSRDKFVEKLEVMIGELVRIKTQYKTDDGKTKMFTLGDIHYNNSQTKKDLIRVLTLLNVHETMNEITENPLFDFELFKSTNPTSLEHIHPQNLRLDDKNVEEWYASRKEILKKKDKIPSVSSTDSEDLKLLDAIQYLDSNLSNRANMDDKDKKVCEMHLNTIDKHFDELANIGEDEMHTIKNMALVDGPVNSAFSNRLLNEKREIMYEKASEHTEGHPNHYIMISTRRVFNKVYTPKEDIHDLEFWGKIDRKAYYDRIEKVYNIYVK